VGTSDPREFIAAESQRIPFKAALSGPPLWQDAFKNWPLPPIAGWRNWYKRILVDNSAKTSNWDSLRIAQCLELSLAETPKNENLLIAACHFWSNGVNAFLFRHDPMSPTLAQLMARYTTMDPILFSATSDKRKALSLIAPPAAKRKITTKKGPC
jgi:hypothetical protein